MELCNFRRCILLVFLLLNLKQTFGSIVNDVSTIRYNMASLLELSSSPLSLRPPSAFTHLPELDHQPKSGRKRGRRGGIKERMRRRQTRPYLPSIIMGNTQSLNNKLDELAAMLKYKRSLGTTSLICITETWFTDEMPDSYASIDGYSVFRSDRQKENVGKDGGGGVGVYVNDRWCNKNNVHVKGRVCTPDLEMLSLSMRPHYIPREFSHVIVVCVYVPCKANTSVSINTLVSNIHDLENSFPDAFILISGDFNNRTLGQALPSYKQQVTCNTRKNKILDLCYTNIKDPYTALQMHPLGKSDHNMVQLLPKYVPKVQSQPPKEVKVKQWTNEAVERLNDCFDDTNWSTFIDAAQDINDLTETVCAYINFCVDVCVQDKLIKVYSNNKPWITNSIKEHIHNKHRAFRSGNAEKLKKAEKELRRAIRLGKRNYRIKLEQQFAEGSAKQVWESMRKITGFQRKNNQAPPSVQTNLTNYIDELNMFYARFDCHDFSNEQNDLKMLLRQSDCESIVIDQADVRRAFKQVNEHKGPGPDKIHPKVLKKCNDALSFIFTYIFNLSLKTCSLPKLWKTSCIIPVPKKTVCHVMNDLRPIAMTSVVMKIFERFVLSHLQPLLTNFVDPLQFAYCKNRSVEDAILYVLNTIYEHIDHPRNYVRIMFFDFSSAFNTIQPHLMGLKLKSMNISPNIILWILDYLTNRPQYVHFLKHTSNTITTQTGAPQGTVLSPFLFALYTADCRMQSDSCSMVKYADDTSLCGLINKGDEAAYRMAVEHFVLWCKENYLLLNVSKTKEMIVDFRNKKNEEVNVPIRIDNEIVERVNTYKYLGIVFDENLTWNENTTSIIKKCQSRLFFLRKLESFNVGTLILDNFYSCVLHSVIVFGALCWGGNVSSRDISRIDRTIRKAGRVVGKEQLDFRSYLEKRDLIKMGIILKDNTHPLNEIFILNELKSGRFQIPKLKTERFRKTFVPRSIALFNKHFKRSKS